MADSQFVPDIGLTKKHIIQHGDDAAAAKAADSFSPDEDKRFRDMVNSGADPYHAVNLIHSQRAQDATRGSVDADSALAPSSFGDKLRAAAVNAGDTATGGGLSTLSSLATSMPDLRPDWLRNHTVHFGDGSGGNDDVADNQNVLADVQAKSPVASGLGGLAGLIAPILAGGAATAPAKAFSAAGDGLVSQATPSVLRSAATGAAGGAGIGGGMGALHPDADPESILKSAGFGALTGGLFGGASGLNDALKSSGGNVMDALGVGSGGEQPAPAPAPAASDGAASPRVDALKAAAKSGLRVASPRGGHLLDMLGHIKDALGGGGGAAPSDAPTPTPPGAAPSLGYGAMPQRAPAMSIPGAYGTGPAGETTAQLPIGEMLTQAMKAAQPDELDVGGIPTDSTELETEPGLPARGLAPRGGAGSSPVPDVNDAPPSTPPLDLSFLGQQPAEHPTSPGFFNPGAPKASSSPAPPLDDAMMNAGITPPMGNAPGMQSEIDALQAAAHDTQASASPFADTSVRPAQMPAPGVAPVFRGEPTPSSAAEGDTLPHAFRVGGRFMVPAEEGEQAHGHIANVMMRLARLEERPQDTAGPDTANMRVPGISQSPSHGDLQPGLFDAPGGDENTHPDGQWGGARDPLDDLMAIDPRAHNFLDSDPMQLNPANRVKWQQAHDSTRAAGMPGMKGALTGRLATHQPPRTGFPLADPMDALFANAPTRFGGAGEGTTQTADFAELLRQLGITK